MKLQNSQGINDLLLQITTTVNEYYSYSFKIHNDRCLVILIKLIEQLEDLLNAIKDEKLGHELRDVLHQVANAMAIKDYVLIRDLLHYELRSKLNGFKN